MFNALSPFLQAGYVRHHSPGKEAPPHTLSDPPLPSQERPHPILTVPVAALGLMNPSTSFSGLSLQLPS